jgi:hypothetical protein
MRILLLAAALLLSSCGRQAAEPSLANGSYSAQGRDRLCVTGEAGAQRLGFITFGGGDTNCSARGRVAAKGATWELTPTGDADCRIPLSLNDGTIALGPASPACAYYCGPGASFAGRGFRPSKGAAVTDLAGDPLC